MNTVKTLCMLKQNKFSSHYLREIKIDVFVVWHLTPASKVWKLWTGDKTPENTEGFEAKPFSAGSQPLLSFSRKIISLHVEIKCVYFWHMHSSSWVNTRTKMRSWNEILPPFYVDNAFIKCEIKAVLGSTNRYKINSHQCTIRQTGDQRGRLWFMFSDWPQHECRCAAWQVVFMFFDTWQNWKMSTLPWTCRLFSCKCHDVLIVSMGIRGCRVRHYHRWRTELLQDIENVWWWCFCQKINYKGKLLV